MASALMAMEHFNQRQTVVVPQLDQYTDCPVQLTPQFFDTGPDADKRYLEELVAAPPPCAGIGPSGDMPAVELGTMGAALRFPLVVHRAFDYRAIDPETSPYSTLIGPDTIVTVHAATMLLFDKGRYDFVALLYPLTMVGTQWRETWAISFDNYAIQHMTAAYNLAGNVDENEVGPRQMTEALQRVKESGYRTIVVTPGNAAIEIPAIAQVAVDIGLTNGDYLWVFVGNFDSSLVTSADEKTRELLAGSLLLMPNENIWFPEHKFLQAWKGQGAEAAQKLNQYNPIIPKKPSIDTGLGFSVSPDIPGSVWASDDIFQTSKTKDGKGFDPSFGAGYVYDSVIATGMGLCKALEHKTNQSTVECKLTFQNSSRIHSVGDHISKQCFRLWCRPDTDQPKEKPEGFRLRTTTPSSSTKIRQIIGVPVIVLSR